MWYKFIHFFKDRLIIKLALAIIVLLCIVYGISGPLETGIYKLLDYYYFDLGNMIKEDNACREAFDKLLPLDHEEDGIKIGGFVVSPKL